MRHPALYLPQEGRISSLQTEKYRTCHMVGDLEPRRHRGVDVADRHAWREEAPMIPLNFPSQTLGETMPDDLRERTPVDDDVHSLRRRPT